MRVEYYFPRRNRVTVRVLRIVGLAPLDDEGYVPMMWETRPIGQAGKRWFDIKYQRGRGNTGLNKPAVLTRDRFRQLLDLYRRKAGEESFP